MLVQYQESAQRFYTGGRFEQAIVQAQRMLTLDPGNEEAIAILAWSHLYLDQRDDIWKSEQYFQELGGGIFSKTDRNATLGHGLALRRQGDFLAVAAAQLEKEGHNDSAKAAEASKRAEQSKTRYAAAVEKLEKAYKLDPEATDALDALQQIYALQGAYEKSLGFGKKFVDAASQSRPFWEKQLMRTDISADEERLVRSKIETNRRREAGSRSLLASCYFKQQRYADALLELDSLLQIDSERTEEYFNRALCREKVGDLSGAIADMEAFLKKTPLGFESPQVRKAYDSIAAWNAALGKSTPAMEVQKS